jgi:hypothetical protein
MGLRESLAIIARSLQGLLRVAEGYQVRRAFTTDEQRFVNGATMDIPAERPNGPSHAELVEAREANHKRRNPWDR